MARAIAEGENLDEVFRPHGGRQHAPSPRPLCTVLGCHAPINARGLCQAHYARAAKTGAPSLVHCCRCGGAFTAGVPAPRLCPDCAESPPTYVDVVVTPKGRVLPTRAPGHRAATGPVPYGLDLGRENHSNELPAVQLAFRLAGRGGTTGRDPGSSSTSLAEIAAALDAVAPPARGGRWQRGSVAYLLHNPAYRAIVGPIVWNKALQGLRRRDRRQCGSGQGSQDPQDP